MELQERPHGENDLKIKFWYCFGCKSIYTRRSKKVRSSLFSKDKINKFHVRIGTLFRAVVSGGTGGTLAPPVFGSSVNLFQPEGAHYAHPITASTPGFQNLMTALHLVFIFKLHTNKKDLLHQFGLTRPA